MTEVSEAARPKFKRSRVALAGLAAGAAASVLVGLILVSTSALSSMFETGTANHLLVFFPAWGVVSAYGVILSVPVCLILVFVMAIVLERSKRTSFSDARRFGAWIGGFICVAVFSILLYAFSNADMNPGGEPQLVRLSVQYWLGIVAFCLAIIPASIVTAAVARKVAGAPVARETTGD